MGFEVGTISYKPYIAEDEVLEMHYKGKKVMPGDKIQKTSVIDLVVGDGLGKLDDTQSTEDVENYDSDFDF